MRFKLSIVRTLALAGFLVLAAAMGMTGTLWAQDSGMKIVGDAAAAFGTYTRDDGEESLSGYHSALEANVRFRGGDSKMDYEVRLRARGHETGGILADRNTFDDGQLQTIRIKLGWNVTDSFRIELGKTGGIDTEYSDTEILETPGNLDANLGNFDISDDGSINFIFKAGDHKFGLAIVSDCQVGCGSETIGTDPGDEPEVFDDEDVDSHVYGKNMIVPYYYGTFGPVTAHVRMAQNSAKTRKDDAFGYAGTTLTASAQALGLAYETDALYLGFDYEAQTIGCDDEVDPDCEETKVSAWGLGGKISGIYFTYSADSEDAGGDSDPATHTFLRVGYEYKLGKGSVYPEYAQSVSNDGGEDSDDLVESYIRLAMKYKF